jgi:hypothetical protein
MHLVSIPAKILKGVDPWLQEATDSDRRVWHKKPLAVFLLVLFVSLLLFWAFQVPPPGYAATALAVAAAVMTLTGEMKGKEKLAWILLLFAFLGSELRANREERNTQVEIQKAARYNQDLVTLRELQSFEALGRALHASINENDRHFLATTARVDQTINTVTGGDGFLLCPDSRKRNIAYVYSSGTLPAI